MYLDDPGHRLYERLMEAHFANHPLSLSVLGTAESIHEAGAGPDGGVFQPAIWAGEYGVVGDGPV